MKKLLFLIILLLPSVVFGQQLNTDSLKKVWQDASRHDTVRLIALNQLAWTYVFSTPDSTLKLSQLALSQAKEKALQSIEARSLNQIGVAYLVQNKNELALEYFNQSHNLYKRLRDKKNIAQLLNNIGVVHNGMGNFDSALNYFKHSLEIREEIEDWNGIAASLHTIGDVYRSKGDYANAMDYFFKSLDIRETKQNEAKDDYEWKRGMANTLNNIGLIYHEQKENVEAYNYYKRSLEIRENLNEKYGIAVALSNIGRYYLEAKEYDKALENLDRSISIQKELGDKQGWAINLGHKGNIFSAQGKYELAQENFEESLSLREEIGDPIGVITAYKDLGDNYQVQGDYAKAIEYAKKSLESAKELGASKELMEASEILYKSYKKSGKSDEALEMHELYRALKDSIQNAENRKKLLSIEFAKQKELSDLKYESQLERAKIRQYALWSGLALLLALGLTAFNAYRNKKRDNEIISAQKQKVEEQKELVEEKNQKIWDSITYAERIQAAILPPMRLFKAALPESYVIYQPKDIVAGDFFWLEVIDDLVLFAAADCTGHGVPGAIVSVVCNNALNRSVREFGLKEPAKILDKTKELVIETFEKSEEEVKDGMDIAICSFNNQTLELQYAGANNSLYHITEITNGVDERTVKNETHFVNEIKADRQPIGKHLKAKPFTNHLLQLKKDDVIVLFSDGFADQFGGPEGKKYKYVPFKQLLLSIHEKSMDKQKDTILQTFENWKGKEEQVDDVCIIGVRV